MNKLFEVINELGGQENLFDFSYPLNSVTDKSELEDHFVRRYKFREIEFSDSSTFKFYLEELWLERIVIFNERIEVQAEASQLDRLTTVRTEMESQDYDQPDTVVGNIQADNRKVDIRKGFEGQSQFLVEQHMALFRNIEEEFIDSLEELFSGLFDNSDLLDGSYTQPVSSTPTDVVSIPYLEDNYTKTSDIDAKNTSQDLEIDNNTSKIDINTGRIDSIQTGALGKQVFTQSNLQSSLIIDNDKRDEWQKVTFLQEIETDSDVIEFLDLDDQWVFKQDGVVQLGGVYALERDQSGDINVSLKIEATDGTLIKQIDVVWDGSNEFFRGVFSNAFRITTENINKPIEIFIKSNKRMFVNRFEPLFVQTITSGFTTDNVQFKDVDGLTMTEAIVDTLTINQVITNPGDPVEEQITIDEGSDEEIASGKALIEYGNTIKTEIDNKTATDSSITEVTEIVDDTLPVEEQVTIVTGLETEKPNGKAVVDYVRGIIDDFMIPLVINQKYSSEDVYTIPGLDDFNKYRFVGIRMNLITNGNDASEVIYPVRNNSIFNVSLSSYSFPNSTDERGVVTLRIAFKNNNQLQIFSNGENLAEISRFTFYK